MLKKITKIKPIKKTNKDTKINKINKNKSVIKIGPKQYKILKKQNLQYDKKKCSGLYDYRYSTIELDKDMDKSTTFITLWHESIHAILQHNGHNNHNELLVDQLAHGIVQILIDNPWMSKQ